LQKLSCRIRVLVVVIVNAGFAGRSREGWTGFAGMGEGWTGFAGMGEGWTGFAGMGEGWTGFAGMGEG
jgi:hypothetical protein